MKQLLITIAAMVLVGCGGETDYTGKYIYKSNNVKINVELKQNSVATIQDNANKPIVGTWQIKGSLIIITPDEGEIPLFLDKTTFKIENGFAGSEDIILKKVGILEQCKTCKNQVSVEAKLCPHCGQPDPAY